MNEMSVEKEDTLPNKMKNGTAVFNQKYGLGLTTSLVSKDEVKVYFLEGASTITLPLDRLQFVKGYDPDLAVPYEMMSISRLKEEMKRLANVKDVRKKGSATTSKKKATAIDSEMVTSLIIKAALEGRVLTLADVKSGKR